LTAAADDDGCAGLPACLPLKMPNSNKFMVWDILNAKCQEKEKRDKLKGKKM